MTSANEIIPQEGTPETWLPLLDVAAREVFEIMLGCKLEVLTEPPTGPSEFTAMVGLAGQLCGVLTMRCTAMAAILMTSKMLGIDVKEDDPQMWDAIGEVANMLAGNFKNKLTGMGDKCMLSVPTVITGASYSFHSLADAAPLEVMFTFEGFAIVISLEIHS
jgi:CheY-specific phosphatase CheX